MNTMLAFAMGEANRGKEMKVFDWDKAARIIAERKPYEAKAGLIEDWEWTGDTIYEDGEPDCLGCTYLASTWATPVLIVDGDIIECWVMESETKYNAETTWIDAPTALDILNQKEGE